MFWWFFSDLFLFIRVINRVLETRFPCGRHMKKMSHQTWSDHKNWVSQTRDASKKSSFETMLTNYIVWKMGSIPNFGHYKSTTNLIRPDPWTALPIEVNIIYIYISWSIAFIIVRLLLSGHIIHPFSTFFFFLIDFRTYYYTFSNFSHSFYLFIPITIYLNIIFPLSLYLPLFFTFLIPLLLL